MSTNAMSHEDLWAFSQRVYAHEQVAQACLALQDRCNLDVNLLLFCAWLGAVADPLAVPIDWMPLLAQTRRWQSRVVVPLRRLRRRLKSSAQYSANAQRLRQGIAACELQAEAVEQWFLASRLPDAQGRARQVHNAPLRAAEYLRAYFQAEDVVVDAEVYRAYLGLLQGVFGLTDARLRRALGEPAGSDSRG